MYSLKALVFDKFWEKIKEINFQIRLAAFCGNFFIAITLIVGMVGFLTMATDLWDGVIISHAISLDRPDVYHEWFSEAGLFFTPYIYDAIYIFRGAVSYDLLAKLVTVFFLILSAGEVVRISERYFNVDREVRFYTAILFYMSPAWVLYYSNIYLMHSLTLFVTLICTRYILDRKALVLCVPLLLLSFQQSSNAPLSISLILLNCMFNHVKIKDRIINIGFILIIAFGFFALRNLFPTHGLYESYNKIHLEHMFAVGGYFRMVEYFVLLYFPSFLVAGLALYFRPDKKALYMILIILVGVLLNGVAYIAVNKIPSFSEIGLMHGESLRFTFTSTVFAVLLLPAILQPLVEAPRLRILALMVILMYACAINIYAHEGKMKEVLFQRGMINEIKNLSYLPSCAVNIKSAGVGVLTGYEYGHIFYRAYGETNQLPLGDSQNPVSDIKELYKIFNKDSYRVKYFMPAEAPGCVIDMNVSTSVGEWGFVETFTKYLSGSPGSIVKVSVLGVNPL